MLGFTERAKWEGPEDTLGMSLWALMGSWCCAGLTAASYFPLLGKARGTWPPSSTALRRPRRRLVSAETCKTCTPSPWRRLHRPAGPRRCCGTWRIRLWWTPGSCTGRIAERILHLWASWPSDWRCLRLWSTAAARTLRTRFPLSLPQKRLIQQVILPAPSCWRRVLFPMQPIGTMVLATGLSSLERGRGAGVVLETVRGRHECYALSVASFFVSHATTIAFWIFIVKAVWGKSSDTTTSGKKHGTTALMFFCFIWVKEK